MSLFLRVLRLFLLASSIVMACHAEDAISLQPNVIHVEDNHARKQLGSISMPFGSPWCNGKPTFWMIGHQPGNTERPWCLVSDEDNFVDYDYNNSTWELSPTTVMDRQDPLNRRDDGNRNIDRHDCAVLDVNFDGIVDIVCGVGAEKGTGHGYNEIYVTHPTNGTIVKALRNHGLNRWPYMRNRMMITLTAADDGLPLVLLATKGRRRSDGKSNIHRMFKLSPDGRKEHGFFFSPVGGPWTRYTQVSCLHRVDVNQDGLDDILMCQDNKVGRVYLQHANGTFTQVRWSGPRTMDWRNARIADITGDGIPDLVVVGDLGKNYNQPSSYIRVFKGASREPFFDFSRRGIWYEREMPFATPDVEILDANHDGIADLYVVQTDENDVGTYCGRLFDKADWWGPSVQPPASFVPPLDEAPDLLLVGTGRTRPNDSKFQEVWMDHAVPGCGTLIEPFGNNYTMILSHGNMGRAGFSVLLQWYPV